jgi:predicted amidohydrolase YtcJ
MTTTTADLIVFGAKVTTLDDVTSDDPSAFAVRGERFVAVGGEDEVMRWRGERTRLIDAGGRRVIPGLNDPHLHAVRGGLLYNLELRWDGVATLERGLEMIGKQAGRTPAGHWVRVMGGWSPFQFAERRMPSVAELNNAAPDTPVLVLFAYSEVTLNKAAVEVLRLTQPGEQTTGGGYELIDGAQTVTGNKAVYATIAKLPGLTELADRIN